jgi:hypothetical protein
MAKYTTTLNGVELRIYSSDNDVDKKTYVEVYPEHTDDKMFIEKSLRTGNILRVSVFINNVHFLLSEKSQYQKTLDTFSTLVSKFSNNQNK